MKRTTTIAKLELPASDVALSETFEKLPELKLQMRSIVSEGSHQAMPLVWISGEPRVDTEEALMRDSSVDQFNCLIENSETAEWLYHIEYLPCVSDIFTTIFTNNGTLLEVQCSASHWTFQLMYPDRKLLSATITELKTQGIEVDILHPSNSNPSLAR